MTAVDVVMHVALARRAESLNGELLALLHARSVSILDDGHRLSGVDLVLLYGVAAQVLDALNWVSFLVNFNLVGLHCFLDLLADVGEAHVDTCSLDSGVSCVLHGS